MSCPKARQWRSRPTGAGLAEAGVYRPRSPQESGYYQCVEDHFEEYERVLEERFERVYGFYRSYLRSVICRYLDCGILCNGFARVRCGECGHEYLLSLTLTSYCAANTPHETPHILWSFFIDPQPSFSYDHLT